MGILFNKPEDENIYNVVNTNAIKDNKVLNSKNIEIQRINILDSIDIDSDYSKSYDNYDNYDNLENINSIDDFTKIKELFRVADWNKGILSRELDYEYEFKTLVNQYFAKKKINSILNQCKQNSI